MLRDRNAGKVAKVAHIPACLGTNNLTGSSPSSYKEIMLEELEIRLITPSVADIYTRTLARYKDLSPQHLRAILHYFKLVSGKYNYGQLLFSVSRGKTALYYFRKLKGRIFLSSPICIPFTLSSMTGPLWPSVRNFSSSATISMDTCKRCSTMPRDTPICCSR